MTDTRSILLFVPIGAIAFWGPDIALHAIRYEGLAIRSFLLPFTLLGSHWVVNRYAGRSDGPSVAIFMLLGVWLFGSTAMMAAASFYGGGFLMNRSDLLVVIALGLLPPYTLMMSAYDGSVVAIVFGSLLMLAAHLRFERHHWIVPIGIRSWFMRGYERS